MIQNELATSNSTTLRNGECDFESYLHNIILAHRTHHPGLVRIPREVRDLRGVTTMDKLQNKRTIVTICYHLLPSPLTRAEWHYLLDSSSYLQMFAIQKLKYST